MSAVTSDPIQPSVLGLGSLFFCSPGRRWTQRFLDFLIPNLLYLYVRIWHRYRPSLFNPLPSQGAALLIANHPSHADAAFLIAACRRRIHFLQARQYHEVFFLRFFFRLAGCIPVTRGGRDVSAIRTALECLQQGAVVGLFTEGDITPADVKRLRKGETGAALLALRSRAPVFPAFIAGAPPARGTVADWVQRAPGVRVYLGSALDLSAYYDQPLTHSRLREVTELFMRHLAALRPCGDHAASTS